MHAEQVTITVRYTGHTYVARCKGQKKTASCVYNPKIAAQSLARKLGFDETLLVLVEGHPDRMVYDFAESEVSE